MKEEEKENLNSIIQLYKIIGKDVIPFRIPCIISIRFQVIKMSLTPLSHFHDITRDEIIARYRDRISQDKRSKLGKSDLEQLILILIDRLKIIDDRSAIKTLCDAEIALLEFGYQTNTIAFDYLPKYRKAVEKAIADGIIPITDSNSHRYIHTQRVTGIEEERFEHYALTYLKYDPDTYEKLDTRSKETNRTKQLSLKGVNPDLYLYKLNELLHSQDKFVARHQAIALAGLTGRRLNEVLARGKFTLSDHPYLLKFEGHSKVERDAYDIVTLVEAAHLLPILEQFRERNEIQPLLTLTGDDLAEAINKFDVQVNRECNKYLGELVPPLEGRNTVSVHNLRGLWGAIASLFFCPPSSHEYPFLQHYLGHAIDSAATGHYFRYRLVNEDGNYIENRGVKIALVGELPLSNYSQKKVVSIVDKTALINQTKTQTVDVTISEDIDVNEAVLTPKNTEITNEQLSFTLRENSIPPLSLLPSCADNPLAQSLQAPLTQLLHSDRYTHILTGLMAVTGLKAGELLKSKKFYSHPNDPFALLFSPTIATTQDQLVTLVDAHTLLNAIARLKSHPDVQPLLYLSPSDIDSRCSSHVVRTLFSHLPFKDIEEMVATYQSLVGTDETLPLPEKPKRLTTTIYNVYTDDRSRLEALADSLGFDGTQANIFHSLLDWVEGHLKPEATPIAPQPNESLQAITDQAKTLAWLTQEITTLRERVGHLELERDELKSQVEQANTPDPQVALLKSENDRLSNQLEQAHSTLSVFRQLLNADSDHTKEQSIPTKEFTEPQATTKNKDTLVPELIKSSIDSSPQLAADDKPTPKTRRPRSDGGAKARAIAIFNALQQWNQLHPDYTFALTPALLEVTFHIHRQAAHDFINEFREQIDHHHHAIGVTTVRTHNRGKDIEPLKAFLQQVS
jgi:hypothetical protein